MVIFAKSPVIRRGFRVALNLNAVSCRTMQPSLFESPDHDLYRFERHAHSQGFQLVAGVDEAGRGPLAGPVVAAAVILRPDRPIDGVNDSKN